MTPRSSTSSVPLAAPALEDRARDAVERARKRILELQRPDGHWCALLETDTTITSEFLVACRHLGRVDEAREQAAVRYLSSQQAADGGWRIHPSGGYSHDTTIKAYFAMKAAGVPAADPRLCKARKLVLEHGGVESSAVFTKIHLAILGQLSWDGIPCIPPEMLLLPRTSPFNIYEMSYWCRTILVPLTIVQVLRKPGHLPTSRGCGELFRNDTRARAKPHADADWFSWKKLFYIADRALKGLEPMSPRELRARSLARAERWILQHLEHSDGLGAIHPAMLNTVHALWMLGYDWDDPVMAKAWDDLLALGVERDGEWFMQPCLSPVWDTALAALALSSTGSRASEPHLVRAADWLLAHRTTLVSDWRHAAPHAPPGCWAFQYRNDHYPDVDDTAMVLMALRKLHASDPELQAESTATGLAWVRSMQSRNGGWGAFDRNNDRLVLQNVPFADHGALLDMPTPDLAGRALELLGTHGFRLDDPAVQRGLAYLRREQEVDGSWFGRWGVNHIYGTWSVLEALRAVRLSPRDPAMLRAAAWLEKVQNRDGGWGESPDSYVTRSAVGRGPSTPSQTSWALLGLMAAGHAASPSVQRGIEYLCEHQGADGEWPEREWTGTGFPGVLYLKYHMYPLNFPLLALGRFLRGST
jgi:squalene-hopene/tetraprenyl-beta-curcumene cyclase